MTPRQSVRRVLVTGFSLGLVLTLFVDVAVLVVPIYDMQLYDRVIMSHNMDTLAMLSVACVIGLFFYGVLRRVAWMSFLTIVFGLGGVLTWAAVAQIDRAVPASGYVVASGKRKTISLLEGGILQELLIHEGDHVVAGQALLRLDDVQVQAARTQAQTQDWSAVAKATRLAAEALDQRELTFPEDLRQTAAEQPAIAAAVAAGAHQFAVRWNLVDASVRVQDRKVAQTQSQMGAINVQIASAGTKLSLTREEVRGFLTSPVADSVFHSMSEE